MFRLKPQRLLSTKLAGIQYLGLDGITAPCVSAIAQLLSGNELISRACLLTCESYHAFLLITEFGAFIAIKAGFGSGYTGEGPTGLANALILLNKHNVEIEEYIVSREFFERVECSCLLQTDIESITTKTPVRPRRWQDYVYDLGLDLYSANAGLARHYPSTIPFALIDKRITDLAMKFRNDEDAAIISAFRRLEDIVRTRTGLAGEGVKLFSRAFLNDEAPLRWNVFDEGESKGRANLFNATFMAYRNARVHREIKSDSLQALREFLLVNELYHLESEALTNEEMEVRQVEESSYEEILGSLSKK
jgi:hypothetical protein